MSWECRGLLTSSKVMAKELTIPELQAFQGNFSAALVHLQAVRDLVDAKGGVKTIIDDFYLSRCIAW